MKQKLQISVRALVEFILRSGDLELTLFSSSRSVDAIRAHQKIQKSRQKEYSSEIPVSHRIEIDTFLLEINGRIDGIYVYPGSIIIDEIKTTTQEFDVLEQEENQLHWGQVKCYAYIYAAEHDLNEIETQLTYYQIDTGKITELRRTFSRDELEVFFHSLVSRYLEWACTISEWCRVRDESIRSLEFPFPVYRSGQRTMAEEVNNAIRHQGQLLIQAPTGIGKTVAAVFPSIKAIAEGLTQKVFYLTARTTGKTAVEKALGSLREQGLRIKSLNLTAKEKICFNPVGTCTGDECEFARGYYDRIGDAVRDAFCQDNFNRETIEEIAVKFKVCPFEFSLDLSLWADYIICDYNYAFDPRVYLRRFFLEESDNYTFLVDEAHNLVDRAREMFSAEINKQPFLDLRRSLGKELHGIYRILGRINSWFVKTRKRCEEEINPLMEKEQPSELYPLLRKFITAAERWLSHNRKALFREELLTVYFSVSAFLRVSEHYDESYATCYEKTENDLRLKLFCIDPAGQLGEALKRCRSVVFFSATLVPTEYFRNVFGCDESARDLILPSPFPDENLCLLIADRVSTLYRRRETTKREVAQVISSLVKQKKGNYLIFFPSYEYMMMIYDIFTTLCQEIETIIQTRGMTETERDMFLERFTHDNREPLAGFAVMGGIFGEGIDLIGDRLTGAVIVGVGLPGISPERELIRDYYTHHRGAGFEFAYLYPGINKVFQAAGRVIRSEQEKGVVLLIDKRFTTYRYRSLFPREWHPVTVQTEEQIEKVLIRFWTENALLDDSELVSNECPPLQKDWTKKWR